MKLAGLLIPALTLLLSSGLAAQTLYVSDELEITMRTGPSTENAIVQILTSGTAVEMLENDIETGYTRVRSGAEEGWVLTRFLVSEPVARDRLAELERQFAEARAQSQQASNALAIARQETSNVERQLADSEQRNVELSIALKKTDDDYRALRNDDNRQWALVGAGVLMVGILLGLLLPRLRVRRRSRWDEL